MKKTTMNTKKFPKLVIRGGKLSKETQEGISEFFNFIDMKKSNKEETDEDELTKKGDCYTIDDLLTKYEEFKLFKDAQANEKLREKFTIFIDKMRANQMADQKNYDETVSKLLNYITYLLGEALSPIYNYDNLVLCDISNANANANGKTYKLLSVLNDENTLTTTQIAALDAYNAKLIEILDLFTDFDNKIRNENKQDLDTLYRMAENFHQEIELAKPILNEKLILIDQDRNDISDMKDRLPSKGGKDRGSIATKYKSTGQIVFILYKKKKFKRTIYVKEKKNTKYCKINNEYILLSKLNIIE